MQPGETILIEALDEENGVSSLRFSLPRVELHDEVLDNMLVTAVRPDWTDNRGLLGYYNPLLSDYAPTPFLHLVLRAQEEALAAAREGRPAHPFFAILDEMNLARVEHYFSDFLSALESEQALHLHADAQVAQGETGSGTAIPRELSIPDNLFFTGTVNVDETTYMFSPKVLDRTFTIEFNRVDLRTFGADTDATPDDPAAPVDEGTSPAVPIGATTLELTDFPGTLVYGGKASMADWEQFGLLADGRLRRMIISLHDILAAENRHFGYRVANEIARFVVLASEQAGDNEAILIAALDLALLQKVLPKFHGTQQELEPLLTALFDFAAHGLQQSQPMTSEQIIGGWRLGRAGRLIAVAGGGGVSSALALPRTTAKLWAMLRRIRQQGFASFIE